MELITFFIICFFIIKTIEILPYLGGWLLLIIILGIAKFIIEKKNL